MIHAEIDADARIGLSRKLIRLRDPVTGRYLHLSGSGATEGITWAWSGTRDQAARLRAAALRRDEAFPWRVAALKPPPPATTPDRHGNPTPPGAKAGDRAS